VAPAHRIARMAGRPVHIALARDLIRVLLTNLINPGNIWRIDKHLR
jgi:hypothetical protein